MLIVVWNLVSCICGLLYGMRAVVYVGCFKCGLFCVMLAVL